MLNSKLILILLVTISTTLAELNGKCQGKNGICIKTDVCSSYGGKTSSGYCPNDPPDVLCCEEIKCSAYGKPGNCLFTNQCSGERADGLCPGGSDFKCCLNNKLTTAKLDHHIKMAYEYAHNTKLPYKGGAGTDFPPLTGGRADCVALAFRALYTLGFLKKRSDLIIEQACEKAGLVSSTDPNDAWRHHGIVLMHNNEQPLPTDWGHVYYSLGGTGLNDISKYDLGEQWRIDGAQPFNHVRVNEWPGKKTFIRIYYVKE